MIKKKKKVDRKVYVAKEFRSLVANDVLNHAVGLIRFRAVQFYHFRRAAYTTAVNDIPECGTEWRENLEP